MQDLYMSLISKYANVLGIQNLQSEQEIRTVLSSMELSLEQKRVLNEIRKDPVFKKLMGEVAISKKDTLEKILGQEITNLGMIYADERGPRQSVKNIEILGNERQAIYADGYKVKYVDNLDCKYSYDKENKTINIKNGLSNQIKIMSLLEVYSSEISSNDFEKDLLKHVISKGIGIDDEFDEKNSLLDWYKNTDIKSVDKTLKLLSSKGRKFIDNFNRFFDLEPKYYPNENISLYDDYNYNI